MKINVEIDGTDHTIDIVATENNNYNCFVDGCSVTVDVSVLHNNNFLSVYSVISHGKSYDVVVYKNKNNSVVSVNGHDYTVKIKNPFDLIKNKEKRIHDNKGSFQMLAPIPGKIIDIKVSPGERVKKGQAIVVIEAMKMENELKSPSDGSVTKIYVKVNNNVEKDAVLLNINTEI